jgi:molybdopterin-containing oxidoreductase family iron-sulfur binding subunit
MKMLLVGGAAAGSLLSLNAVTGGNILSLQGNPKHEPDANGHVFDSTDLDNPLPNDANMALGMVIDLNKCDGCQDDKVWHPALNGGEGGYEPRCTAACRTMHNVAPEQEWMKIYYKQDNPMSNGYYFPRPCMQCQRPPCVRVCPVGAAFHRPLNHDGTGPGDGLVLIKYGRCIGCRTCMAGCPYEVRYFNWSLYDENTPGNDVDTSLYKYHSPMYATKRTLGTVEKCDFCGHLGYGGKLSACTQACPKGAIYYGNLKDDTVTNAKLENIKVSESITTRNGFRMKEELGTKPRVFYLPKTGNSTGSA